MQVAVDELHEDTGASENGAGAAYLLRIKGFLPRPTGCKVFVDIWILDNDETRLERSVTALYRRRPRNLERPIIHS